MNSGLPTVPGLAPRLPIDQLPVSVFPEGKVPPAVHGEPSLPSLPGFPLQA